MKVCFVYFLLLKSQAFQIFRKSLTLLYAHVQKVLCHLGGCTQRAKCATSLKIGEQEKLDEFVHFVLHKRFN